MRILVTALIALVTAVAATGCGGSGGGSGSDDGGAQPMDTSTAAHRFLDAYVTSDGRVQRKDEGDDIVSEGQAYGMLIAEIAGRDDLAQTIWSWTKANLQRPDDLISWHADPSGKVLDQGSATDADVLLAYALLRYSGTDADSLHRDGQQLAHAVLQNETVDHHGAPVPVAGPWALTTPYSVDPSYWMPGVYDGLATLTGDQRWSQARAATVDIVSQLTGDGSTLPSDWATLDDSAKASGSGNGNPVQYGADAERMPIWFAYGCDDASKALAAKWWGLLSGQPGALALNLDGSVLNGTPFPVAYLGAAAAAHAAGDDDSADDLRGQAAQAAQQTPTYYGDAWLALSGALADGIIGGCRG